MNVLVFAPHNDDEVLGVGGTIKRYSNQGASVFVCEVTSGPKYKMMQEEAHRAHQILGVSESIFMNLPVAQLADYSKVELNEKIGEIVCKVNPEIVYVPFIWDMHLDHRYVTEAVLVAVRPLPACSVKKVYMYETLSETGWNVPYGDHVFSPNVWVDISSTIDSKCEAMKCYESQIKEQPHPRSIEGIKALASYRGATVGVQYAESFMLIREIE